MAFYSHRVPSAIAILIVSSAGSSGVINFFAAALATAYQQGISAEPVTNLWHLASVPVSL